MVATALLGLIAAGGIVAFLAATAIIIKPLSLVAAVLATVFGFTLLEQNFSYGFGEIEDRVLNIGIAITLGAVTFKVIGWLLLSFGIIAALAVGALLLLGGPGLILALIGEVLDR